MFGENQAFDFCIYKIYYVELYELTDSTSNETFIFLIRQPVTTKYNT